MEIYCPSCERQPTQLAKCSCGNEWNAYETNLCCPKCSKQFDQIRCSSCGRVSDQASWFHDRPATPFVYVDPAADSLGQGRLPQPKNPESRVTRYMSIEKYVRFLRERALYLARIDRFDDPFEGSLPKGALTDLSNGNKKLPEYLRESLDRKYWSRQFYVSCWYMSDDESDAMWRLFGGGQGGICVVSTYASLAKVKGDGQVHIGRVSYLDYDHDNFGWWSELAPVMHKRRAFTHENEIRILLGRVCSFLLSSREEVMARLEHQPVGYRLPCSPEALVDAVLVSPYADESFYCDVADATRQWVPELEGRVRWSDMRAEPMY